MTFDYYAALQDESHAFPSEQTKNLASGTVDGYTQQFMSAELLPDKKKKDKARRGYQQHTAALTSTLPNLNLDCPGIPLLSGWLVIDVAFTLQSPWYSKDDRPFHVLDNPVRKDRVFGVPFMAAASWKGLLRWACRMREGLLDHLARHKNQLKDWKEPAWIVHLFGNTKEADEEFSRGALQFFPTWFDQVNFEVINPHSREKRAGTLPIVYEVVPAKTQGSLQLLYAPVPGQAKRDGVNAVDVLTNLCAAMQLLLQSYGFSAKRTAGWGLAKIDCCKVSFVNNSELGTLLASGSSQCEALPSDASAKLLDGSGRPLDVFLKDGKLISINQHGKLNDRKPPCTTAEFKAFKNWYEVYGKEHQQRLKGDNEQERPVMVERKSKSLGELSAALKAEERTQDRGDQ